MTKSKTNYRTWLWWTTIIFRLIAISVVVPVMVILMPNGREEWTAIARDLWMGFSK